MEQEIIFIFYTFSYIINAQCLKNDTLMLCFFKSIEARFCIAFFFYLSENFYYFF